MRTPQVQFPHLPGGVRVIDRFASPSPENWLRSEEAPIRAATIRAATVRERFDTPLIPREHLPGGVRVIHRFASQNLPLSPQPIVDKELIHTREIPPAPDFCVTNLGNRFALRQSLPTQRVPRSRLGLESRNANRALDTEPRPGYPLGRERLPDHQSHFHHSLEA
jgi:hypothetical protein